jgi:transmembrane sensor
MKTSQQHHDSAADEQAALWAARLDGDTLDRAQRAELDAWLAEKPIHRTLLSQYCQFSADLEEQVPALVEAGAVTMPPSAAAPSRRRWKWTFPRLAGVAFAAAAAIAVTVHVALPGPPIQNVSTAPRQRASQTLADGTRVELNANTSLRFENSETERVVRLAGGEALFMVTKDPNRPFIIETPTGSVLVTGTTFNVRTEPAATAFEVTVIEGSVQVRPVELSGTLPSVPVALVAGEQFSVRGGAMARQTLSESDLEDALAWREGKIVFRDSPLSEAMARYARYHGRSINVHPAVAKEPIGGRYSIDDLRGFLHAVESTLPKVKVIQVLSGAYTVGPR